MLLTQEKKKTYRMESTETRCIKVCNSEAAFIGKEQQVTMYGDH